MSFSPPCCPYSGCPASKPVSGLEFKLAGTYQRRCDDRLVQRYRCPQCKRRFSDQSFRLDYGLRRPELDRPIFEALVSKVSHRQTARVLHTRRRTVERRLRRYGEHCRALQALLLAGKKVAGSFSLDEAETFETDRRFMPLTLPLLIERDSRFFLHVDVDTLPARKATARAAIERQQRLVAEHGKRVSGSHAAVKRCFAVLAAHTEAKAVLEVLTDKKKSYPAILKELLTGRPFVHAATSSKARRDTKNPLFAINHSLAMLRDGVSRLVRRTWCNAKARGRLALHLWIYTAWRNFVRSVSNERRNETPAMALKIDEKRWSLQELLRWRAPWCLILRGQ